MNPVMTIRFDVYRDGRQGVQAIFSHQRVREVRGHLCEAS
jgi:hypothetical protein